MSSVPFRKRDPAQPVPYFSMRDAGRFLDLGMVGQSQVAVRAEHQHLPAVDDDLGVLSGGNGAEVGIETAGADFGGAGEIAHLVEQRQRQASARRSRQLLPVINDLRGRRMRGIARQQLAISLMFKRWHLL